MSILDEPKVDTHCHLLDPQAFPYPDDVAYRPSGQEVGNQPTFEQVMSCHGVRHALLVGPNSGYNFDNRCLLHALDTGVGRFKGVVVLRAETDEDTLRQLKARGVVGVAFNVALNGLDYYAGFGPLLKRLERLGLWAQFQVTGNQLVQMGDLLRASDARLMIDHCGRPDLSQGLNQPGFQALLALGRSARAVVKISGEYKYSQQPFPFDDTRPYIHALVDAFGLERCLWASDWPYLRAPFRLDYGPMLRRWESLFSYGERHTVMWDNPVRLFGFDSSNPA